MKDRRLSDFAVHISKVFKYNLQLALSIISKERGLREQKKFCCFFPN